MGKKGWLSIRSSLRRNGRSRFVWTSLPWSRRDCPPMHRHSIGTYGMDQEFGNRFSWQSPAGRTWPPVSSRLPRFSKGCIFSTPEEDCCSCGHWHPSRLLNSPIYSGAIPGRDFSVAGRRFAWGERTQNLRTPRRYSSEGRISLAGGLERGGDYSRYFTLS